jgi:hypothetical protein
VEVGKVIGASLEGVIADGRIVGVDMRVGKVVGASLEGVIADDRIAGVDLVNGEQALTVITRTTIEIDLFIIAVALLPSSVLVCYASC